MPGISLMAGQSSRIGVNPNVILTLAPAVSGAMVGKDYRGRQALPTPLPIWTPPFHVDQAVFFI